MINSTYIILWFASGILASMVTLCVTIKVFKRDITVYGMVEHLFPIILGPVYLAVPILVCIVVWFDNMVGKYGNRVIIKANSQKPPKRSGYDI